MKLLLPRSPNTSISKSNSLFSVLIILDHSNLPLLYLFHNNFLHWGAKRYSMLLKLFSNHLQWERLTSGAAILTGILRQGVRRKIGRHGAGRRLHVCVGWCHKSIARLHISRVRIPEFYHRAASSGWDDNRDSRGRAILVALTFCYSFYTCIIDTCALVLLVGDILFEKRNHIY